MTQDLIGGKGSGLRVGVRGSVVPALMPGNGPWATFASDSGPGQHEPLVSMSHLCEIDSILSGVTWSSVQM